jgi:hypothetical protein
MKEHFPDLAFEVQGNGLVALEQWQNQERVVIDVHPQQLAHIGRALFKGRNPATERIEELERRLAVLSEKIQDFVMDDFNRGEILDRSAYGSAMLAELDALRDLAWEFDGGLVPRHVLESDEAAKQAKGRSGSQEAPVPQPAGIRTSTESPVFALEPSK